MTPPDVPGDGWKDAEIPRYRPEPDVPARIGVPVTKSTYFPNTFTRWFVDADAIDPDGPTHLAFPVTPEAVAEMRGEIAQKILYELPFNAASQSQILNAADSVLRALGFDGGGCRAPAG